MVTFAFLGPLVPLGIVPLAMSVRILREYERGVVFTLGRFTGVKGPGLILLVPAIQQMVRADHPAGFLEAFAQLCLDYAADVRQDQRGGHADSSL